MGNLESEIGQADSQPPISCQSQSHNNTENSSNCHAKLYFLKLKLCIFNLLLFQLKTHCDHGNVSKVKYPYQCSAFSAHLNLIQTQLFNQEFE